MKVAIFSILWDRLDYTKHCFKKLKDYAGYPYDHFVVDNGSTDGTIQWLEENTGLFKQIIYNPENYGISKSSNQAIKAIKQTDTYDLICKFDNDCEVITPAILEKMVHIYEAYGQKCKLCLSPGVSGLMRSPPVIKRTALGKYSFGQTNIIGGLFNFIPAEVYDRFRFDETLPKWIGQDDTFCAWLKAWKYSVGYIEEIQIYHIEGTAGQLEKYPEYFNRKKIA